jgi:hypothetical protein
MSGYFHRGDGVRPVLDGNHPARMAQLRGVQWGENGSVLELGLREALQQGAVLCF